MSQGYIHALLGVLRALAHDRRLKHALLALAAAGMAGCTTLAPDQSSVPVVYAAEAVAYAPDGRHTAAATGASDSVFLFDAATNKPVGFMTPKDGVTSFRVMRPPGLAFSHDGQWLASSSWQDSLAVRIWDVARHVEARRIAGQPNALRVAFSPDDRHIGAAGPR